MAPPTRSTLLFAIVATILLTPGCKGRPDVSSKEPADEDPHTRADAALRLGQARATDAEASLIAFLDDPDELVRINVVRALGEIGGDSDVAPLQRALGDQKGLVRQEAFKSLEKLEKS
jgi:HEAT repeat protein